MPEVISAIKNRWGAYSPTRSVFDSQRTDLFVVDFGVALGAVKEILERVSDSSVASLMLQNFPTSADFLLFASAVEFPEARTAVSQVKRNEFPYPNPGHTDPTNTVTMTFRQPIGYGETPVSQILAFLRAWRAVVLAGRSGMPAGELSLDLLQACPPDGGLVPNFRHPVQVKLLKGLADGAFQGSETGSLEAGGLEVSGSWTLVNAWVVAIQVPALDHSRSGLAEVRAHFACDTVTEFGQTVGASLQS